MEDELWVLIHAIAWTQCYCRGTLKVMTEVLHANIFFFIASAGVILLTLLVCLVVYHVLKIVKSVRRMVERFEHSSEMIAEDVEQLRSYVVSGSLFSQLIGFFMRHGGAGRRRSRADEDDE